MPLVITRDAWYSLDSDTKIACSDYLADVVVWIQGFEQDDGLHGTVYDTNQYTCIVCRVPLLDNEYGLASYRTVDGKYQYDPRTVGCFDCVEQVYLQHVSDQRGYLLDRFRIDVEVEA